MTDKQLREQIRPLADEILRVGARLYRDKNWLGGRAEVDEQLDVIMQAIKTYADERLAEELNKMHNHYELKGGRMLLYERDGENVYLSDRIAELTNTGDTSV